MLSRPFQTLTDFHSTLEKTEVYLGTQQNISLNEGLQRVTKSFQEIDRKNRTVWFVGNGGSAAIASHQAVDLSKNAGIKAQAFNDSSLLTCFANDFSYAQVFEKPISLFAQPGDLLIAVSSSGKSENILRAVHAARKQQCSVITYSGFQRQNELFRLGDLNFYVPSESYGIVEVGHLLLIHASIDEVIQAKKSTTLNLSSEGKSDELQH